jgi:hypothetical protein
MKFCQAVPEICRGHVHVAKKERRIIIIRNGAKTISLQTTFGRLNYVLFQVKYYGQTCINFVDYDMVTHNINNV